MDQVTLKADLVVMGGGIAGHAIIHEAATRGLTGVVIENGVIGQSHYATGFLSPRPDYLPQDIDSVRETAGECLKWAELFPEVVKEKILLVLIGPNTPYSFETFEGLLKLYDSVAAKRFHPPMKEHSRISRAELERMEPILKKNHFNGAFGLQEWMVEPDELLKAVWQRTLSLNSNCRRILIKFVAGYVILKNVIREIHLVTKSGQHVKIESGSNPLVVINTAGPWIGQVAKALGIDIPLSFRLGVQAAVPGQYINSHIIAFGNDGKYIAFLQKEKYLQVGPTDTPFPQDISKLLLHNHNEDVAYLNGALGEILEKPAFLQAEFLKQGLRIGIEGLPANNRPFIWTPDASKKFPDNYFAVIPGKMALANLVAGELFQKLEERELLPRSQYSFNSPVKSHGLDGGNRSKAGLQLLWNIFKSHAIVGLSLSLHLVTLSFKKVFYYKNPD